MSDTTKNHLRLQLQARAPHPATTVRRSTPHPATAAQRKAAHPASVMQRKAAHPAIAPQGSAPHPATVPARGSAHAVTTNGQGNVQQPSSVIQQAKWSTGVKASTKETTRIGKSGNGSEVGHLLKVSTAQSAAEFLAILLWLARTYPDRRSPFSCAEPHAVAQVIAATGAPLSDITVETAWDSFGDKDTCPICSEWLVGGQIVDPRATPTRQTPTTFPLASFVVKKEPKKKKRRGKRADASPSNGAKKFWDEDYGLNRSSAPEPSEVDWRDE